MNTFGKFVIYGWISIFIIYLLAESSGGDTGVGIATFLVFILIPIVLIATISYSISFHTSKKSSNNSDPTVDDLPIDSNAPPRESDTTNEKSSNNSDSTVVATIIGIAAIIILANVFTNSPYIPTKNHTYETLSERKNYTQNIKETYTTNERLHRNDGPALIWYYNESQPSIAIWYQSNRKHRDDGNPAKIEYFPDGSLKSEQWFERGRLHRTSGPAIIDYNEDGSIKTKYWYENGDLIKKE